MHVLHMTPVNRHKYDKTSILFSSLYEFFISQDHGPVLVPASVFIVFINIFVDMSNCVRTS